MGRAVSSVCALPKRFILLHAAASGRAPVALQVTLICFCSTIKRDFGKIQYQQIGKYLGDEAEIADSQNHRIDFPSGSSRE